MSIVGPKLQEDQTRFILDHPDPQSEFFVAVENTFTEKSDLFKKQHSDAF